MNQMLEFYHSLRQDKLVQDLGREKEIREIAENIRLYTDSANMAKYTGPGCRYLQPDKKDIQEIAYHAGTFTDIFSRLGNFGDMFKYIGDMLRYFIAYENPLDKWLDEHEHSYRLFRDYGLFPVTGTGKDLRETYLMLEQPSKDISKKTDALEKVLDSCQNLVKREFTLAELAGSAEPILHMYENDIRDAWNRILNGDFSGYVSLGQGNELNPDQVFELMKYFFFQARVNGQRSKTAHLLYLRYLGKQNSEELVEMTREILSNKKDILENPDWVRKQLMGHFCI